MTDTSDEAAFRSALLDDIAWFQREINYRPTRWIQMIDQHGPVEAARRLLGGSDASDGFTKLWENDALDRSVEWRVLCFLDLFTYEERQVAYERLRLYEVPVDDWLRDKLGRWSF